MPSQALHIKVDKALKQLVTFYANDPKSFITENDVVLHFFNLLSNAGVYPQKIHGELKPYLPNQDTVLTGYGWKKRGDYRGARLDLAIVDMAFWDEAYRIAPKNCWRFLLFPIKGFQAAFEFKIRVRGNHPRILDDANLLLHLKTKNPECVVYLIILDRFASKRTFQGLMGKLEPFKKEITIITH